MARASYFGIAAAPQASGLPLLRPGPRLALPEEARPAAAPESLAAPSPIAAAVAPTAPAAAPTAGHVQAMPDVFAPAIDPAAPRPLEPNDHYDQATVPSATARPVEPSASEAEPPPPAASDVPAAHPTPDPRPGRLPSEPMEGAAESGRPDSPSKPMPAPPLAQRVANSTASAEPPVARPGARKAQPSGLLEAPPPRSTPQTPGARPSSAATARLSTLWVEPPRAPVPTRRPATAAPDVRIGTIEVRQTPAPPAPPAPQAQPQRVQASPPAAAEGRDRLARGYGWSRRSEWR